MSNEPTKPAQREHKAWCAAVPRPMDGPMGRGPYRCDCGAEPTKPAPATDEMRDRAQEFRKSHDNYKGVCIKRVAMDRHNQPAWEVIACNRKVAEFPTEQEAREDAESRKMADFASQVLQQAEQRIAELRHDHHLQWQVEVDLRKVAERERDEARAWSNKWESLSAAQGKTIESIQGAVQAERERCAEIIEGDVSLHDHSHGLCFSCKQAAKIRAAEILSQPTPPGTKGAE